MKFTVAAIALLSVSVTAFAPAAFSRTHSGAATVSFKNGNHSVMTQLVEFLSGAYFRRIVLLGILMFRPAIRSSFCLGYQMQC
jgi:hypothetical protein